MVYAGSGGDRAVIRELELYHAGSRTPKFNVLLASYETVLRDKGMFKAIQWETVIVDEAHRMKNAGAVQYSLTCCVSNHVLRLLAARRPTFLVDAKRLHNKQLL